MIESPEMKAILRIVKTYLNKPVVFAEQNRERPREDYVAMYMIGQQTAGRSGRTIDKNGMMKFSQKYDLEVCFDCVSKSPYEIAIKIANMWPLTSIQEALKLNNIAWHKNMPIKNTSTIYNENYLSRVSFEAFFYIETFTYEQNYLIEKVKINGINK